MSTTPTMPTNGHTSREEFVRRLRNETTAIRLRRAVFGNTRTLDKATIRAIAERYGCDEKSLRAKKVLLNRAGDDRIKRCYSIVEQAIDFWKLNTVPYSHAEKGVRLMRRDLVPLFEERLTQMVDELSEAVAEADAAYDELLDEAKQRLAELFDRGDYPTSLIGKWKFDWEYPSVEPPEYLKQLNPELYEAELDRIQARFSEALEAAEQGLIQEFSGMLAKLAERLSPDEEGNRKTFQKTSLTNLQDFFQRFQHLSIGSNAELDRLVTEAQELLDGKTSEELRNSDDLREQIAEQVEAIYSRVADQIVDRPARAIDLDEVE